MACGSPTIIEQLQQTQRLARQAMQQQILYVCVRPLRQHEHCSVHAPLLCTLLYTGSIKAQQAVQQQVAALSTAIKNGLQQAVHDALTHPTSLLVGLDLQQQQDQTVQCDAAGSIMQRAASPAPGNSTHGNKASQQQQQGQSSASVLQELLQLCRLLRNCKLAPDATCSAVQLLQHSPSLLWDVCAQLAQQNLLELTARLDEAQREMLAPLHWPGSGQQQQQHVQLQYKADQQQLVAYSGSSGGHGSSSSHRRLPWSSGLSMTATAALQQRGVSLPPEVRVKMRLKDHVSLHVQTEQALQRVRALQQQLDDVLGSTALLQAAAAAGGEEDTAADAADGAAAAAVTWEAQLAQLFLNTARVRAQVALLQQYEHRFGEELAQLQEIKAVTEEKELEVRQQVRLVPCQGRLATNMMSCIAGCWHCMQEQTTYTGFVA